MSTATELQIDADQLEVSRIRALRGPNYWRLAPVIACDVQLGTLEQISSAEIPGFYERLSERTRALTDGLAAAAASAGISFSAQSIGGMFGIYFAAKAPQSHAEVMTCDKDAFNRFFHRMLDAGVYFAPSAYEAGFVSAAHTAADIEETVRLAALFT